MVPEFRFAAEAAQLDHGQHEIEAVPLRGQHDLPVEREARPVLRSVSRDQPAVVADWNEDADFHVRLASWSEAGGEARLAPARVPLWLEGWVPGSVVPSRIPRM